MLRDRPARKVAGALLRSQRRTRLMLVRNILVIGAMLIIPATTFAQSADTTYCKAMATKFRAYNKGATPAADVATAIAQCDSNPGNSIPVLEKQLTGDKIALPSR